MLHVVEEPKSELDPVTVHSLNMVVKPVQDQPQRALAVTQITVQLMEAGVPGAPMVLAVRHVVEKKSKRGPVTVHSLNMVVKRAKDQLQRVLAVTQTHVLVRECFN